MRGEKNLKNKKLIFSILIIIIIVCSFLFFKDSLLKIVYPKTFKEVVYVYTEKYNLDENLIFAVIKAESNFNKEAISNKGAIGLMQLMEKTAEDVARKNNIDIDYDNMRDELKNVYNNIEIGSCYLANLMQKYQNVELSLAAYNAGTGNVDKWIEDGIITKDGKNIENIPYKETNNYVRKILRDYKIYQNLYEKN